MRVSIIGATGYTGAELVRILAKHPQVELDVLTSESFAGKKLCEVYPSLKVEKVLEKLEFNKINSPFVFTALPAGKSAEVVGRLFDGGAKVVDLSADFRLEDAGIYARWYGISHPRKELLGNAVYGLPEINRERIKEARLVANPGCYPTSIIIALAPLLKNNLVKKDEILIDAKSGVSGAGRNPTLETHFPEVSENICAYKVTGHRHLPEMQQELEKIAGGKVTLTFVPHLIPVNRGILSTCYAKLLKKCTTEDLLQIYREFYRGEPFVEILPEGVFPHTKDVLWQNRCRVGLHVEKSSGRVIVLSAIDNLVKGGSGQAVQNMNLMCGFKETTGLEL